MIDSVSVPLSLEFAAIGVISATVFRGCCVLYQILASFSRFELNITCKYNAVALKFGQFSISSKVNIESPQGLISMRQEIFVLQEAVGPFLEKKA